MADESLDKSESAACIGEKRDQHITSEAQMHSEDVIDSSSPNNNNNDNSISTTKTHQSQEPSAYESTYVHDIYAAIAPHFSRTRHKPWPLIASFLSNLPVGSIGLDVGCGNGKYLPVNPSVFIVASDRTEALVSIAKGFTSTKGSMEGNVPGECIVADVLDLPHPGRRFDFAICVAVIHHLSTRERRVEGIRAILDCLSPSTARRDPGRALMYVWALEQKNSRRGWDEGSAQDVMVPWVMKGSDVPQSQKTQQDVGESVSQPAEKTFQRYYHLYRRGELEEDIARAHGVVLESGYEKDNWWAIATPRNDDDGVG